MHSRHKDDLGHDKTLIKAKGVEVIHHELSNVLWGIGNEMLGFELLTGDHQVLGDGVELVHRNGNRFTTCGLRIVVG
jgi:hypothetical protein